ncbi:MAG: hypothetical protein ACP5NS_02515 [Candidatus Pacearchaeota archaeon]
MVMIRTVFLVLLVFLFSNSVYALCSPDINLINQDPIFATPGEYVDLVFQVEGVEDPSCGLITIELLEEYPFSLDSDESVFQVESGTYVKDFNSFLTLPYKVRVDSEALDGDQPLKIKLSTSNVVQFARVFEFNISVEDVRTDFITTIDSYSFADNQLVIGLINIGDEDARAITVEIPEQESISIDGGHIKILGDLDSNEDTTISFSASPSDGDIKVIISYNDQTNVRRTVTKNILFTSKSFDSTREKSSLSVSNIILWVVVLVIISYLFWIRHKRKKNFSFKN